MAERVDSMANKEYIERDSLLQSKDWLALQALDRARAKAIILGRRVADVVEVRHGFWHTTDTMLGRCCECSVCGSCPTMEYRYCPYCGAKMDGGDK